MCMYVCIYIYIYNEQTAVNQSVSYGRKRVRETEASLVIFIELSGFGVTAVIASVLRGPGSEKGGSAPEPAT